MSAFDKLADVIRWAAEECVPHADKAHHVAVEVRERFVVIDRNDLPEVVPDADTSTGLRATAAYDAEGHVAEAYITSADQGYHSATPEWHEAKAKVHLAAAEYLRKNPPVDEKAVEELAQDLARADEVQIINGKDARAVHQVARRLIADGWGRVSS